MAADTKTLITAEQFQRMSFPDERVELSDGELIRMAPAGFEHGRVAVTIAHLLKVFVDKHALGTVVGSDAGFRLNEQTVRAPDVGFVCRERVEQQGTMEAFWPGAPDLAVEVVSPDDSATEVRKKIKEYFAAGTQLVWVVYPRLREVHVYRGPKEMEVLAASDMLSGDNLLPGFSISVESLLK